MREKSYLAGGWASPRKGQKVVLSEDGGEIGFEVDPQKCVGLGRLERRTFHVQKYVSKPLVTAGARRKSTVFGVLDDEVRMIPTDPASLAGSRKTNMLYFAHRCMMAGSAKI